VLGSVSLHGVHRPGRNTAKSSPYQAWASLASSPAAPIHAGCEHLLALDSQELRLRKAAESGATQVINIERDDLEGIVSSISEGRGLDLSVEASGYPEALLTAFGLSRIGGGFYALDRSGTARSGGFHELPREGADLIGCNQPSARSMRRTTTGGRNRRIDARS